MDFVPALKPPQLKAAIKSLLYKLRLGRWLNVILYNIARIRNFKTNRLFRKQRYNIELPPDKWLFNTYKVDYRQFLDDGQLAALEIRDWTRNYLPVSANHILDWGCGTGRIIQFLPTFWPGNVYYGCDPDEEMINWNRTHYPDSHFAVTGHHPPTHYKNEQFQLVFGFSVLTHIHSEMQKNWLMEMYRIISAKGILLVTTHGSAYLDKLTPAQKKQLEEKGMTTQAWPEPGSRMMATYHSEAGFKLLVSEWFDILEFYDGEKNPRKAGGQDVWILQKKSGF